MNNLDRRIERVVAANNVDAEKPTVVLAELQHRVRNTLAMTRLIARRSAETSESLEDYVAHLDGRLAALARIQSRAIIDPSAGIDLGAIIFDEASATAESAKIDLHGPELLLHPRAADPLALAFHELMTNAIKFGALGAPNGKVAISWSILDERLFIEWLEAGSQFNWLAPRRHGFGTDVLTQMLAYELGAKTLLTFSPSGLLCRIEAPLNERVLARAK